MGRVACLGFGKIASRPMGVTFIRTQHLVYRHFSCTTSASNADKLVKPSHASLADIRARYKHQGHGSVCLERYSSPGIATIKLQNPQRRNALSPKMQSELADIVDELERECVDNSSSDMGGVIVMGSHHTFCSGFGKRLLVPCLHLRAQPYLLPFRCRSIAGWTRFHDTRIWQ